MCCLFVDGLDSTLVDLTDATTIVDRPLSSTVGPEISLDVESREFGRSRLCAWCTGKIRAGTLVYRRKVTWFWRRSCSFPGRAWGRVTYSREYKAYTSWQCTIKGMDGDSNLAYYRFIRRDTHRVSPLPASSFSSLCRFLLHVSVFTCRFNASRLAKPFLQRGQMFGGTFKWIFSCLFKSEERLNPIPQSLHL